MPINMCSYETDFVARVAAMDTNMYISKSDAVPVNPILAAQKIASTADALARMSGDFVISPLRHEVTLPTPTLKRNYGSLDLSRMLSDSCSSSNSSVVSTPIDGVFPMHRAQPDEGDFIEQDVSPASSAPNSPALEFSTHGRSSWEFDSFGVAFGPNLTPEFVSADEVSGYLDFMDALEDCDSIGRFAENVVSDINSGTTYPSDLSPSSTIEMNCADSDMMEVLLASPNPLFDVASPRISHDSWGIHSPILDAAPWTEATSPVITPGTFDMFQWTRSIALIALLVNLIRGLVY
ncbi:unnamed protein product [Rhizoctonia solani]|uniref:Uncharacterized protein n=1 Tax=Rhizoctonia solani TaxID=456999 RepID=A0A8H2WPM2_9AGAM|nr:unnamed protein product [Rhizoctonia solani]